jgi:hypothetical protein
VVRVCGVEFKWEDVKNDKYRENYLGHSVNAPVGRWQKNKDLTWYAKASTADRAAAAREELALAKQRDEDLMNEAMYGVRVLGLPRSVGCVLLTTLRVGGAGDWRRRSAAHPPDSWVRPRSRSCFGAGNRSVMA